MIENKITAEGIIQEALEYKDKLSGSDFPTSIFPEKIREIIRTTNKCLNFPVDYIAASLCFAISIGIGNTHVVRVKETWLERSIMFLTLIGRPGSNKSHPLSFSLQPFLNADTSEAVKFKELYKNFEELSQITRKEREEQGISSIPQEPILKKFIVSDITPESIAYIHQNNKRGICLYADELAAWFKNFNRYSRGSEEQFWLSRYSGKAIILDRRGAKATISIQNSFIGVVGTIQQGILKELARGDRSQNGFLDRILFVIPNHIEKQYWNNIQLPKHIAPLWDNLLSRLINLDFATDSNGEVVPIELSFSKDAEATLIEWQHKNVDTCELESNETMIGIYKKMETYISRFSLLIQMTRWICNESDKKEIDQASVHKAIELVTYFCNTARKVQAIILSTNTSELLNSTQKVIYQNLPKSFTTADGISIAQTFEMPERTFKDFLKNNVNILFSKDKHGLYSKIN